ncbi:lipase member H-like [Chironomus tepperi]|uniref:lipase member H-like n=1 Tax=Chironomus tepperi TaxID=113505 RepID=UPI00391FA332
MQSLIFYGLLICAVVLVIADNHEISQFSRANINETLESNYPNLHLILINPQNKSQTAFYTLQNLTAINSNSWYSPIRNTVIYSFGFTETINRETTQAIIDAYIKRGEHNIIVIDWSAYNGVTVADYPVAIENMKAIGGLVGARIGSIFRNFATLRFHLVGHSLGAHLCAYVNRGIPRSFFTPQIPKIVGLDPAGPYMYNASYNNNPLNPSDALSVQVIHTDMSAAGAPVKCGDIDFYPNGGGKDAVQPGCASFDTINLFVATNFCSHQMSVYYYAESVASKGNNVFAATRCSSYADFVAGKCRTKSQQMGYAARDYVTGDFYLQTNAVAPYDGGLAGAAYTNSTA